MSNSNLGNDSTQQKQTIRRLTTAALILPGLLPVTVQAAEDDSIDFQYSHYQEGRRKVQAQAIDPFNGTALTSPDLRAPIEVDSLHGGGTISLTDRIKFAFNYVQDTWSGATPFGSARLGSEANRVYVNTKSDANGKPYVASVAGASPFAANIDALDEHGAILKSYDQGTKYYKNKLSAIHVMGYASPETRKQGDFKLSYDWDEAAVNIGGGISLENDYESRFVNLGGRMDFNQKQTTLDANLSYTNSSINALLSPLGDDFFLWTAQHEDQIVENKTTRTNYLRGTRQDWASHIGLTQVINQDAVAELGMSYTRSTGFLENPYKLSWFYTPIANSTQPTGVSFRSFQAYTEQRPDERNLWQWNLGWNQYLEPLDAALHFDYSFAHDDWGINAHTFEADWVQPLGAGWTVTPRIRYYSQSAADFYAPYFDVASYVDNQSITRYVLPQNFSSDQRLSGYGTLSGGITVEKQFAKGVSLQTGFEYYTHQGSLKLGGGGEGSFADFDYWVANAALKINLSAIGHSNFGIGQGHNHHTNHTNVPAGVLFGHSLEKAGDMMVGYRYMRNWQGNDFLRDDSQVSELAIASNGCPGRGSAIVDSNYNFLGYFGNDCKLLPNNMIMSMHMLDLMYAPTDWLTLMLMPQFVDMDMGLFQPSTIQTDPGGHGGHIASGHQSSGIGDTGMYALVKLFDRPNHHLHATVGLSAPTGDVDIKLKDDSYANNRDGAYTHYGMQLGSGTWDFKPSLTYTGKTEAWSWGAQAGGTVRLENRNASGYVLGDMFEGSVWGGYDFTHWLTATVRAAYSWQGNIKGLYPRSTRDDSTLSECKRNDYYYQDDTDGDGVPDGPFIFDQAGFDGCFKARDQRIRDSDNNDRTSPMDTPANYGGHYVDIGFGLSATVPTGTFAGNRLAFEWMQPVYTNVNGYQLDRDGALSFTWSYGF